MELTTVVNQSVQLMNRKSPLILTVTGIGLGVGTVGLGCIASFKAADIYRELKATPMSNKARMIACVKRIVPLYIPVAVAGIASVICVSKSYDIHARRLAEATAFTEITLETLKATREHAEKILGKEKVKEIEQEVKKELVEQPVVSGKTDVYWFVDQITGQEFLSTKEAIRQAELELNVKLHSEMYVCIDEWIDILNDKAVFANADDVEIMLRHTLYGNENGWREGYPVYISFKDSHTKFGQPAFEIDYNLPPIVGYRERYS